MFNYNLMANKLRMAGSRKRLKELRSDNKKSRLKKKSKQAGVTRINVEKIKDVERIARMIRWKPSKFEYIDISMEWNVYMQVFHDLRNEVEAELYVSSMRIYLSLNNVNILSDTFITDRFKSYYPRLYLTSSPKQQEVMLPVWNAVQGALHRYMLMFTPSIDSSVYFAYSCIENCLEVNISFGRDAQLEKEEVRTHLLAYEIKEAENIFLKMYDNSNIEKSLLKSVPVLLSNWVLTPVCLRITTLRGSGFYRLFSACLRMKHTLAALRVDNYYYREELYVLHLFLPKCAGFVIEGHTIKSRALIKAICTICSRKGVRQYFTVADELGINFSEFLRKTTAT